MMNILKTLDNQLVKQYNDNFKIKRPNISIGDKITVRFLMSKRQKRKHIFTGVCTYIKRKGFRSSFTLENMIYKQKVSKTFILYSSMVLGISKIK